MSFTVGIVFRSKTQILGAARLDESQPVSIGAVTFTASDSPSGEEEFKRGSTGDEYIMNLVSAINAHSTTSKDLAVSLDGPCIAVVTFDDAKLKLAPARLGVSAMRADRRQNVKGRPANGFKLDAR